MMPRRSLLAGSLLACLVTLALATTASFAAVAWSPSGTYAGYLGDGARLYHRLRA
jgi:hypothetical protein